MFCWHVLEKPNFWGNVSIFPISSISSFEIINIVIVIPDPKKFFWITVSLANAAAVNPYGIKTHLASGLSKFFIKGQPVLSNGSKCLSKIPPDYPILCKWFSRNFVLTDKLVVKVYKASKLVY